MAGKGNRAGQALAGALLSLFGTAGCDGADDPALSGESARAGELPVAKKDGPKLGAVAHVTSVFDRPAPDARAIGHLLAGGVVARSEEKATGAGCEPGWYALYPRGFACATHATVDLEHPTLKAMSLKPKLSEDLPYTYARARDNTALYERGDDEKNSIREIGKLRRGSVLAVVGSWNATDEEGKEQRLGLTTAGQFVRAADLKAAEPSEFAGAQLGEEQALPIAFVVKRGVSSFKVEDQDAEKLKDLAYHDMLPLSGRYREIGKARFWDAGEGRYVRHQDVTVIRRRHVYPDFAAENQKWIDISVVTGTLVAYEGHRALFATLVSVGRDRLGDPKTTASTALGTFDVVAKAITGVEIDPRSHSHYYDVYDSPWVLELSSGQRLMAGLFHDRFGIEHTDGSVHLSPKDAHWLWSWATPELPEAWHGVSAAKDEPRTIALIRK
ncbi:MAG TPA: L,D-transpeptidase [Polyangiaceae bacterium]